MFLKSSNTWSTPLGLAFISVVTLVTIQFRLKRRRRRRFKASVQAWKHGCSTAQIGIPCSISVRRPFVVTQAPLGPCLKVWDCGSLEERLGDYKTSIHVSDTPNLNFVSKNFSYATMSIRELIACIRGAGSDRYYYYRSTNSNRKKPSSLDALGKSFAEEFTLPVDLLRDFKVHSSVLRLASPGLRMWIHYDICDNFLCVIRGRKRVVLLHPDEVLHLQIPGSSSLLGSTLMDPKESRSFQAEHSEAAAAWERRVEVEMGPGDVLYIPRMWLHCTETLRVKAEPLAISVNVFLLRPEEEALHDAHDVFANRELLPAQSAQRGFETKVLPAFRELPPQPRAFYCRKMAAQLLAEATAADAEASDSKAEM